MRARVHAFNPDLKFVFHDAFHGDAGTWNDLFDDDDHKNVVMDTHFYQAWWGRDFPDDKQKQLDKYCTGYEDSMAGQDDIKYDIWVGEWSLATDVCALWLGGFNDNNTPYRYDCEWVDCPKTYLPDGVGTDFDRTADMLGPYGSNTLSTVQKGKCPKDSLYFSDSEVSTLGGCALAAFEKHDQGHFLWTFRNELEPRWNYITSYDNGWINKNSTTEFPAPIIQ